MGQLEGYVITDTVGSDREDNNLENIEQNFSDWSDNDSDDDILNRPGEAVSAVFVNFLFIERRRHTVKTLYFLGH